jgi:hypothetical protein
LGIQVAATDANRPIAIAMQSKAMWMAITTHQQEELNYSQCPHVLTIRDQAEAVSDYAVNNLNTHIRQIEHKKVENLPRFWI